MVDDQDKALKFYTEVLGFEKKFVYPVGEYKSITLVSPGDPGGAELLLEPNSNPTLKGAEEAFQMALYTAGIPLAAFEVRDVKQEFKRLKKLGVSFTQEPIRAGAPIVWAVLDDTCGNLIQIFQYWIYEGEREAVKVTRRLAATPERVFDAWVNPELAGKWLMTTKSSKTDYDLDVRVGGEYTITRRTDEKVYVAVGKYLEVDPPRRLVFTFAMPQFAVDVDTVTLEIEPDGDGCVLTVTQSGLRPGYQDSTKNGWGKMFDLLEAALS